MTLAECWGATAAEQAASYPCDRFAPDAAEGWFRALDVRAPREVVFRWLCQMRVAPYSYDWIDNFGRTSPRTLTPGLEELAVGQRFATIFQLVDFTPGEQITLVMTTRAALGVFGPVALTYATAASAPRSTRLVAKLAVGRRGEALPWRLRRRALAWGDLLMMRHQLMVFRDLSEGRP